MSDATENFRYVLTPEQHTHREVKSKEPKVRVKGKINCQVLFTEAILMIWDKIIKNRG